MRRALCCFVALVAVLLLRGTPANADTITVTSGTIDLDPITSLAPIRLAGTGGFSFIGGNHTFEGNSGPQELAPGETATFHLFSPFPTGTVTYGGETFTNISGFTSVNGLQVRLVSESFVAPRVGPSTTTVIAPFTLSGSFRGTPGDGRHSEEPTVFATFSGRGVGRLPLTAVPLGDGRSIWQPGVIHLDILAPTPEPASLLLLGLGMAGVWTLRHQERTRRAAIGRSVSL